MKTLDLTAFTTAVKDEQLAVRGMRVYQNGALVASYQPEPEQRQNQYSGTKSFTSTACDLPFRKGCSRWTMRCWITLPPTPRRNPPKT